MPPARQRLLRGLFREGRGLGNQQARLVLLASFPCLLGCLIAMWLADLSGYLIGFVLIIFALLISYCVVAGRQQANYQLQTLSNLIETMIGGDYSLRGREQSNPAFIELLTLINQLADTLHQHKVEAEESQLLLQKVMEQMDAMVFAVNPDGLIQLMNGSADKLLFKQYVAGQPVSWEQLGLTAVRDCVGSGVISLKTDQINGEFFLFKDRFISHNQPHDLYLLTRADRLLREKEREAWQNLLRVLSHEMNNSLTPIATFSRSMLKKLRQHSATDPLETFEEGLSIIQERAESLGQFIASYSQLSHLPALQKCPFDWQAKLVQLAELTSECQVRNQLEGRDDISSVIHADPHQLEQVFINLLKNANEAMLGLDDRVIELDARQEDRWLHIIIRDCGTGIANADNLFVPFYSTKPHGSGIGLALCRQILMNHDGLISVSKRSDEPGAEAVLSLPVLPALSV